MLIAVEESDNDNGESDNDNGKQRKRCNDIVSYALLCTRRTRLLNAHCSMLLSSRVTVRIRFTVWICTRIYPTYRCHCHSSWQLYPKKEMKERYLYTVNERRPIDIGIIRTAQSPPFLFPSCPLPSPSLPIPFLRNPP